MAEHPETPAFSDEEVLSEEEDTATGEVRRGKKWRLNTLACTTKSSKAVLAMAAEARRWKEVDRDGKGKHGMVYYIMQGRELETVMPKMKGFKRNFVSRYPGMGDMCEKRNFSKMMSLAAPFLGPFPWWPRTFVLPEELPALTEEMAQSPRIWIVKPEDGSQGDGIFLVQSAKDLHAKASARMSLGGVVQQYLTKPLLLKGLKFDLRLYVVLAGSGENLRCVLCDEGLARFCTEPYEAPALKNLHKVMGHLTNYSLNKRAENFVHGGDPFMDELNDEEASKRSLATALAQVEAEYPEFDRERFWAGMREVVEQVCGVVLPVVEASAAPYGIANRCFQILGFDIMLDHKFRPHLLEINNSPSLCVDEAMAMTPEEVAAAKALSAEGGRRKRDGICNCMDMQQPHGHKECAVDVAVKKAVVCTALDLLSGDLDLTGSLEPRGWLLGSLVEKWTELGGTWARAGTGGALRRHLAPVLDQKLTTADLDIVLKAKKTAPQFASQSRGFGAEFGLVEWMEVLTAVAVRKYGGDGPEALERLVGALGW